MDRITVVFIFLTLGAILGIGKLKNNSLTVFFFALNCNRETLETDETQWPSEGVQSVHVTNAK